MKAHFAQAKVAVSALAEAEEVYYSTYMEYTPVLENLDVSISVTSMPSGCTQASDWCGYGTSWGYCELQRSGRVFCAIKKGSLDYYVFLENSPWRAGDKLCFAWGIVDPNKWEYKFCQAETGSSSPESVWAGGNSGFLYRK